MQAWSRTASGVWFWAVALLGVLAAPGQAQADYADGWRAFQRGEYTTAVDLWRESAWRENDLFSQKQLGELYRDGKFVQRDEIESYVWYYLALINPTASGQTEQGTNANLALLKQVVVNLDRLAFFMTAANRNEAQQRIVYILSSRGAEGFFRLGELYDPDDHHQRCRKGLDQARMNLNNQQGQGRDQDVFDWVQNNAPNYWIYCDLIPNLPSFNVIPKSNPDALVYYILAKRLGHPIARQVLLSPTDGYQQYVRGKFGTKESAADLSYYQLYTYRGVSKNQYDVSVGTIKEVDFFKSRRSFALDLFARAEAQADSWQPPFEVYPDGHSDESKGLFERKEALKRIDKLDMAYIQEALRYLTFYNGTIDGVCGPGTRRAMALYQASIGAATTGDLTAEQQVRLIKDVADRGYPNAQTALGTMYFHGIGEPPNNARARHWFQMAANQMEPYAFFNLGVIYRDGVGVSVDRNQAATYFMSAKRIFEARGGERSAAMVAKIDRELKALGWGSD